MSTAYDATIESVALRAIEIMENGAYEDFEEIVHPNWVNHEAKDEPPESRQAYGPAAAYATALWLRDAFADLHWEIHEVVAERDLVVVHGTMSGRHAGTFVEYDAEGRPSQAFPATGKTFATTQTHWQRIRDGKAIEHWANRDDLGMALQCGWVPPTPLYLLRMARAKRAAVRAHRQAEAVTPVAAARRATA
ncbi:MAG: ester cyclase [Thermoleophilia bacterium]